VPKSVEHKRHMELEVKMLRIELRGIVNSGDGIDGMRTAENDVWI